MKSKKFLNILSLFIWYHIIYIQKGTFLYKIIMHKFERELQYRMNFIIINLLYLTQKISNLKLNIIWINLKRYSTCLNDLLIKFVSKY